MTEIVLLLAGAVLGAVASVFASEVYRQMADARNRRHRQSLQSGRASDSFRDDLMTSIVNHYRTRNGAEALYTCDTFDKIVPVLVEKHWRTVVALGIDGPSIASLQEGKVVETVVDQQYIAQLTSSGARLWNGEVLYAESYVKHSSDVPHIGAGRMSYFSHLSEANRLRTTWLSSDRRKIDELFAEFRTGEGALGSDSPLALSASATVVLHTEGRSLVPLQRRSSEVVFWPNTIGVVPTFSFEANKRGSFASSRSVTTYNLLREMAEELYDLEELIEAAASRNANPDWIFNLPEVAALEEAFTAQRMKVTLTAVGVSPFDAAAHYMLLVELDLRKDEEGVLTNIRSNWETSEPGRSEDGLYFVELHGPEIERWVQGGQIVGASVIALDRARVLLPSRV